ncbi:MAG: hypothetical protein ACI9H8_000359 [Lysobacterales bacterium]|jgi:hypothetical protein
MVRLIVGAMVRLIVGAMVRLIVGAMVYLHSKYHRESIGSCTNFQLDGEPDVL